jgi:hypothetical protein
LENQSKGVGINSPTPELNSSKDYLINFIFDIVARIAKMRGNKGNA